MNEASDLYKFRILLEEFPAVAACMCLRAGISQGEAMRGFERGDLSFCSDGVVGEFLSPNPFSLNPLYEKDGGYALKKRADHIDLSKENEMSKLTHAEVINHMAEFGFDSAVCINYDSLPYTPTKWMTASQNLNPMTHPHIDWRIKPTTIKIEACELPEPMRSAPVIGVEYWYLSGNFEVLSNLWVNSIFQFNLLYRGVIFKSKEDAETVAAWLKKTFGAKT